MPGHLREFIALGRTAPAIFVLNANMPVGQTVSELRHIWGASEPHEYENTIRFLPIFPVFRTRPLSLQNVGNCRAQVVHVGLGHARNVYAAGADDIDGMALA